MFGLPHNIVFLIILLLFMVAAVVFTFVFVILVDRSLKREDRGQEQRGSTENEVSS